MLTKMKSMKMNRRTFLKGIGLLTGGALLSPVLPSIPLQEVNVGAGTLYYQGKILEFSSFSTKIWSEHLYKKSKEDCLLHKFIMTSEPKINRRSLAL